VKAHPDIWTPEEIEPPLQRTVQAQFNVTLSQEILNCD
jgi:hypothetical protein